MPQPAIAILTIGSELLDGRVQDTNANFAARKFAEQGLRVSHFLSCDDRLTDIDAALQYLTAGCDLIVISGGLGPTTDDLTREAVAAFDGLELVMDPALLSALQERYRQRQRTFDPSNAKQASRPQGATAVPNPIGTAAGFDLKTKHGKRLISLPGVPQEFELMFNAYALPLSAKLFVTATPKRSVIFKVFGLPESTVGERVAALNIPHSISVSYRACFPEIHVKLSGEISAEDLKELQTSAITAVGADAVYSCEPESTLDSTLHALLLERKLTVAVAESCTAGLLGYLLTNGAGSSRFFLGGVQTYSNQLKQSLLEVPESMLAQHGAVSHEVARAMAAGARQNLGSDVALSVTGIAGPDGGTPEKPVGTFFVGLAEAQTVRSFAHHFPFSRERVRIYAAHTAMDTLRRHLLGLKIRGDV